MNITEITIKTALRKMFSGSHFDICTIDKCLKLSNTIPDKHSYEHMSALHCVYYKEMPEELRQWLFDETITMFSGNGFDLDLLDFIKAPETKVTLIESVEKSEQERKKRTILQRLLD